MLDIKIPLVKVVDQILLCLWYSEHYKQESHLKAPRSASIDVGKQQSFLYLAQAQVLANFIDQKVIGSDGSSKYKGLTVGNTVLDLLELREKEFQHPE